MNLLSSTNSKESFMEGVCWIFYDNLCSHLSMKISLGHKLPKVVITKSIDEKLTMI